jgi:hypothetical protein
MQRHQNGIGIQQRCQRDFTCKSQESESIACANGSKTLDTAYLDRGKRAQRARWLAAQDVTRWKETSSELQTETPWLSYLRL